MKSFILSIYFLIPAVFFAQQSIQFEDKSFAEILQKAKKENKLVFLDAYASWCGPCKMMERNVFTLKSVSDYYNTHFINAHFDMEKGEGREIARKYGIRSYPTYLFLNGDSELVLQNYGYMEEAAFLQIAKDANNPDNLKFTPKQRFENGEKDPEFLVNLMRQNLNTDPQFAKKVSERYFANKKAEDYTRDDVAMLLYFVRASDDANYVIFQKNKAKILEFIPENVYTEYNTNVKISKILEQSLDEEHKTLKEDYYFAQAIPLVGKEEATRALNRLKLHFYPAVGNYSEYEKAALAYFGNPNNADSDELLKAAYLFSEYVRNTASLKKAVEWAEKVVMKNETPESTFVLAKLYQETGNREAAKMYAEQSANMARQKGTDPTAALQLLQKIQAK